MSKNYYLCAFGDTSRVSNKCNSSNEAAIYCFGVTSGVTCLNIGGRAWKYASAKQKQQWQEELKKIHDKTL
jgi:hypothetical protein